MVKLQDKQLARENDSALAMRKRFEERTKRFLNAKHRTIGIDKDFLDHQLEEKNRSLELEKQEQDEEATRQEQIFKYLEEEENLKEQAKRREQQEVNKTLAEQVLQPKNNALGKGEPLDLENCGTSSIQCFDGEDHEFKIRKKMQQDQLREWCSLGIKDKQEKVKEEQKKESDYSKYVIEEDAVRCSMASEEQHQRRLHDLSVMMDNQRLAQERRQRELEIQENEKQIEDQETKNVITSPFFCEDTDYARSAISDHRVRPDHFKGFEKEKLQSIIDANELVVAEKIALKKEEETREELWALSQGDMISKMEEIERERMQVRTEDKKIQMQTLTAQRDELKRKQVQMKQESFGSIGYGFFQKFGTSCR